MFAVIVGGLVGGEGVVDDVQWPQLFTVALWRRGNCAEITRGKWADRPWNYTNRSTFSTRCHVYILRIQSEHEINQGILF